MKYIGTQTNMFGDKLQRRIGAKREWVIRNWMEPLNVRPERPLRHVKAEDRAIQAMFDRRAELN